MSESKSALNIALFGPPGSGKGTAAERLIQDFGFVHMAPGDLLRKEVADKTPLGVQVDGIMKAGQLVSDEIIHSILGNHIAAIVERKGRILLDGFPRTLVQMEFLDQCLARFDTALHAVFFLDAGQETLIERLEGRRVCTACGAVFHVKNKPPRVAGVCDLCGAALYQRKDDNRESIEGRLATYLKQTDPVRQAFEAQGKLVRVDADQSAGYVYERISEKIQQLLEETAGAGR